MWLEEVVLLTRYELGICYTLKFGIIRMEATEFG